MKLKTKSYAPVGEAIWLEWEPDDTGEIVLHATGPKMPPFVEALVLAVGPLCKQVKDGDRVVVNSAVITKMKFDGQEIYFTKELQIVAVVGSPV